MKNLWLVYERDNVARNAFFIEQWRLAAAEENTAITLVLYEQLRFGFHAGRPWLEHAEGLPLPDAAVMRLNQPLLSAHLELCGIPVFNNAQVARVCNDKRLTHQMVSHVAPCMDTVFLRGDEQTSPLPYPVVVKAARSCGGRKVFMAHDDVSFRQSLAACAPDDALVQTLSDTPGRDVRAYVLGKEIVAVMQRFSETDFRSNLGQGGGARPYRLSAMEEKTVRDIIRLMDFSFVGVDFIHNQGRLVFNEIEDAVGTRMLFAGGHEDIVRRYLSFILHTIEKK